MTRGGRRERLARHLCACARHWPRDPDEERRLWEALDYSDRDFWRFIADRARKFLQDEDRAEHEAEVREDEAPASNVSPPPPPTPTARELRGG